MGEGVTAGHCPGLERGLGGRVKLDSKTLRPWKSAGSGHSCFLINET
jgi:hypothetical protein